MRVKKPRFIHVEVVDWAIEGDLNWCIEELSEKDSNQTLIKKFWKVRTAPAHLESFGEKKSERISEMDVSKNSGTPINHPFW